MAKKNGYKKSVVWVSFDGGRPQGTIDCLKGQQFRVCYHSCSHASFFRGKQHEISEASAIIFDSPRAEECIQAMDYFKQNANGNLSSFIIVNPIVPGASSQQARKDKMLPVVTKMAQATGKRISCVLSSGQEEADKTRIIDLVRGDLDDVRKDSAVIIADKNSISPTAEPVCAKQEICSTASSTASTVLVVCNRPWALGSLRAEFAGDGLTMMDCTHSDIEEGYPGDVEKLRDARAIVLFQPDIDSLSRQLDLMDEKGMKKTCDIIVLDPKSSRSLEQGGSRSKNLLDCVQTLFAEKQIITPERRAMVTIDPADDYWLTGILKVTAFLNGSLSDKHDNVRVFGKASIHSQVEPSCAKKEICRSVEKKNRILFISDEPDDAEVDQVFRRNGLILERTDSIKTIEADNNMISKLRHVSAVIIHQTTVGRTLQLFGALKNKGMEISCRIVFLDPHVSRRASMENVCSSFEENKFLLSGRQAMATIEPSKHWMDAGIDHTIGFLKGDVAGLLYNDSVIVWENGERLRPPAEIARRWQIGYEPA